MSRRESKWTRLYWDVNPDGKGMGCYARFIPDFMDVEAAGFGHGLSLNRMFPTKEEAEIYANMVDKFMDAMMVDYKETQGN